jgi:Cytochrome P450
VFALKALSPFHMIDWMYRWTRTYQLEQKHTINGCAKLGEKVFQEKEKEFLKNSNEPKLDEELSTKPQVFIDQLYKIQSNFTPEGLRNEVHALILAVGFNFQNFDKKLQFDFQGFETLSSSISLATILVALHPEVQDKIFEELQSVFSSVDEEVTDEHLKQLSYLDLVIKESMRIWPTIPIVGRCTSKNIEIGEF